MEKVTAVISATAGLISYIIGEGVVDVARVRMKMEKRARGSEPLFFVFREFYCPKTRNHIVNLGDYPCKRIGKLNKRRESDPLPQRGYSTI